MHDEGFALPGNLFGTGIDWEDLFDVTGHRPSRLQRRLCRAPSAWDAPDKDGGNFNEAQFMEGGVNLSDWRSWCSLSRGVMVIR